MMFVWLLLFILVPSYGWAVTTRYVDNRVSNCSTYTPSTHTCGSGTALAYSTIQAAVNAMSNGDTIYVRDTGTPYTTQIHGTKSGIGPGWSNMTLISGYNGEVPVVNLPSCIAASGSTGGVDLFNLDHSVQFQDMIWDGTNCTNGGATFRMGSFTPGTTPESDLPSYIRFLNIEVRNNPANVGVLADGNNIEFINLKTHHNGSVTDQLGTHGVYFAAGGPMLMKNCQSYNNSGFGLQIYPHPHDVTIDGCVIHTNGLKNGGGVGGITLCCSNNVVKNNVLYDHPTGTGIAHIFGDTPRNDSKIENNSITGFNLCIDVGKSGTVRPVVRNNICVGNSSNNINTTGSTSPVVAGNLQSGTAAAIWTNSAGGNFTLKAGSAAIDNGLNIGYAFNGSAPDQGAFETITFASCQVPSSATNKIRVTFNNNKSPPLLPASGVLTFTARKNGSANAVNGSVTRIADGIFEIPLTNSYAGGDTADISWSSGNITDSSLVGNTYNQSFIGSLSNQSCTNNAAGAPTYTYTQAAYELHDSRGLETSPVILPYGFGSAGAAENFANYKVTQGGKIRIRFSVVVGVSDAPPTAFTLFYSTGGSYAQLPDSFGADNVQFCGTLSGLDIPANGGGTTNQLSTGGTFVAGGVIFTSGAIPTVTGLNTGFKTELEYCVAFDTDATGNYDFRVYQQDGTALDTYTMTPRIVLVPSAAGGSGF